MIRKRFGYLPHLGAGVKPKETEFLVKQWNAGLVPILLIHPASAGHGLNLQGASCDAIAWYAMPWSSEMYAQTNARILRQGTGAKTIWCYHIMAEDTVDRDISDALIKKGDLEQAVQAGLKKRS